VQITYAASSSSAIFLDLRFSRSPAGDLAFEVYQKPINRYLYPLWKSEIPRDTLAGIAIGEIIRYIRRRKLASVVAENCMDAPAGDMCCGVQYAGQGSVCKEDFLLAKQLKQLEAADGNRWQ
jgi:hypothetical protein